MALKWTAVVTAAVVITVYVTANVLVASLTTHAVPAVVNLSAIAVAAVATVLAVVAELYVRIDRRLTGLSDFVAERLDRIEDRVGDHNTGFVDGYLLGRGQEPPPEHGAHEGAAVLPLGLRSAGRRAMAGLDD